MNEDLLERASWTWSLSLIALTVAIHVLGVVMMALVLEKIRFRLGLVDNRRLGLRYVIPIVIVLGRSGRTFAGCATRQRGHNLGGRVFVVGRARLA